MATLLRRYFELLERKPLQVKVASALVIFSTADVIAQKYEHKESSVVINEEDQILAIRNEFAWDQQRTFRMMAFGAIVNVWIHGWWGVLEKQLERHISSKTNKFKNAFVKVVIDQAFGSPVFNTIFFSSQQALQGKNFEEVKEAVATRLPVQLARHYTVWPFVHLINFSFVPLHRRVIVQNVLTVGWAAYLSCCEREFDKTLEREGVSCL